MEFRQREIWLANLNPQKGSEPGKVRPVVILQTDDLNAGHPSTIVCPITSNVLPASELLRVHLHPGESGLEVDSDVLIDQIRAIDGTRLLRKLGSIDESTLDRIKANMQILLDMA
ncbi:MAG: type II toxin-antitoxin system PemK/MazF family toxin [Bacteroidota bacterium]|nr:type II toxin-antitoxin system PemK/MazF family toxin [Bacteroidota bacterium]MDP4234726.1 type II toxin-antitoxin system PemK/MazF family toxin [Bacteroidota bacterium]MDP4243949.1 type II toxin-antitoxin system PemK/MazF family toxin [Bacteroidota bacterium]MDP4288828.1 type II toxin-antitoxin system PemK/MazF family toxin [Bacteroidota bacterium]